MKWSLLFCLLLASATLARPRTKRSIGHLKSLIVNKLFGIGGKTVIVARPILSNNETYQLFRIPGVDDFLVKVSKNNKKHEKEEVIHKPTLEIKDPVIVKPEVAIIGSYLGTTTQKETLLAIEMVKNLVRSGILTGRLDSSMQELLIPQGFGKYIEENVLTKPMQVITEEERHIFVPEYPEFFVPPELKLTNPNSKYYYKQKGPDADMTYESHDNKDVFVTRTEKRHQNLNVSESAKNVVNNSTVPISQPLRINGPPGPLYVNQGTIAGHIPLPTQNQIPLFMNVNQGISGNLPEKEQNPPPSFYVNQGTMSGKAPGNDQFSPTGYYLNQGLISGHVPGIDQNLPHVLNVNQGMISGNVPVKGQILLPSYFTDQGMISGKPGQGQNPRTGYYVDQGLISGQGKFPPTYYANQGIAQGGILGQVPYGAPTYNVNSDMIGSAPLMNNANPNVMAGYFGPAHPPSVYYVNPGDVRGSPGQIPPYLSHVMGKPNINEIGLHFIGNDVNGGATMADRNPSLQMDAFVHPYYFGNNAQRAFICKEKQGKACPYDETDKKTLNPTQNTNKPAVNQQSVPNINNTFGNAKMNVVKEFLKNHTVNGQILAQYSYQQINSHSNKNYTEVKLGEPAVVETNNDFNKEFVYIPPGESSNALSLKNEGHNGNDNKSAFTSKLNVRTNKEEIKRFMPSNRLNSNVRSNFKQNPIVVAEKRSNETDEKSTKPEDNNKGEIPGSTF